MIVGLDEVGRGPLVGNVVACALYLPQDPPFTPKDSKKLSTKKREEMFAWLSANAVYAIGEATPQEIDELNILNATFLAFERAIDALIVKDNKLQAAKFIVDGNRFKINRKVDFECIVKADDKVREVSCASIIAKVTRDEQMVRLDKQFPQYGFLNHKGYPTAEHYAALAAHGPCPHHRRSFRLS